MRSNSSDSPGSAHSAIADAVRRRRRALSLTQQELGDLAGCGRLFVHRLETAKSSLRLDKLLDLMTILGLQFDVVNGTKGVQDRTDATH